MTEWSLYSLLSGFDLHGSSGAPEQRQEEPLTTAAASRTGDQNSLLRFKPGIPGNEKMERYS